jgi:hypothetical protein
MARKNKTQDSNKAQKAAMRKAHFANGGSTSVWCGKSNAHSDLKKARNKSSCRKKVQW